MWGNAVKVRAIRTVLCNCGQFPRRYTALMCDLPWVATPGRRSQHPVQTGSTTITTKVRPDAQRYVRRTNHDTNTGTVIRMESSPLHDRLGAVLSGLSYRQIGELTGHNAETSRRYMQGQSPSAEFLATVCVKMGVNGAWLLTGRGPMKAKDVKAQALQQANVQELLKSLAETLERLIDRVDRLETFVHTLETRVRGGAPEAGVVTEQARGDMSDGEPGASDGQTPGQGFEDRQDEVPGGQRVGTGAVKHAEAAADAADDARAGRVASDLSKRPRAGDR
jgi:hypothetical protein